MSIPIKHRLVLHSSFVGTELEETIDSVSIDSRSLQNSEIHYFFAILGPITMHIFTLMI
jgi:alanine racemase